MKRFLSIASNQFAEITNGELEIKSEISLTTNEVAYDIVSDEDNKPIVAKVPLIETTRFLMNIQDMERVSNWLQEQINELKKMTWNIKEK